jgi:hypothetical protein
MKDTQLALQEQPQAVTVMAPMQMILVAYQKALESGGPEALAVADRLLEQMTKQRDYESRDHFNASLLRIQQAMKPIAKRGEGEKPGQKYALIEDIDAALNPLLAQERMNLTFEPAISEKVNTIVVTAILAQGAYERRYPLEMPADGAGPKGGAVMTRTHATGSAMTYAKRYLKNFIFDLQFKQKDDDGNQAGGAKMKDEDFISLRDNIEAARTVSEVTRFYLAAIKTAGLVGDKAAILKFEQIATAQKEKLTQ